MKLKCKPNRQKKYAHFFPCSIVFLYAFSTNPRAKLTTGHKMAGGVIPLPVDGFYGLHAPQGVYPISISSCRSPVCSPRFLSLIFCPHSQLSVWNFIELLFST